MKAVAQDRPQELGLRVARLAQQLDALGSRLLQDARDDLVGLAAARHVVALGGVEPQDVLADLLVVTRAGFLPQGAGLDQLTQHRRRGVGAVERVVAFVGAEVVLQRLDDVGHGVQAHHVSSAEGGRAGAAELLAGQVVHDVDAQAEFFRLVDGGQHAGDADAVGDEVGGVFGPHHRLAEGGGGKSFELVDHVGLGGGRGDQLDQAHVARRVEEVHAAKTRPQRFGKGRGQLRDAQARGVAGDDGTRRHVGGDALVELELPVHALGDGFNDQVALFQPGQVLFVIGGLDQGAGFGHAQRRGLELLQAVDGLLSDAAFRTFLGGQVEQQHRHVDVDQVGRDLRAHHASTQHRDFAHCESVHGWSSL